jgi:hypothetical protein
MYVLTHCLQVEKFDWKQKNCHFCWSEFLDKMNGNTPIEDHNDVPLDEKKRIGGMDLTEALGKKLISGSKNQAPLSTIHHWAYATAAKFFASPNGKPVGRSIMQKRSRTALSARAAPTNMSNPIEKWKLFFRQRQEAIDCGYSTKSSQWTFQVKTETKP